MMTEVDFDGKTYRRHPGGKVEVWRMVSAIRGECRWIEIPMPSARLLAAFLRVGRVRVSFCRVRA